MIRCPIEHLNTLMNILATLRYHFFPANSFRYLYIINFRFRIKLDIIEINEVNPFRITYCNYILKLLIRLYTFSFVFTTSVKFIIYIIFGFDFFSIMSNFCYSFMDVKNFNFVGIKSYF